MKFEAKSTGSKNILSLKDGDVVKGVLAGEPYQFEQHWKDGKPSLCPGKLDCEKCADGDESKFRFKINFIVKENDVYVAKVLEQGWNVFVVLKDLHEGGYNLEKQLLRISRTGSKMNDTKYSVIPTPNGVLSNAQMEAIGKVTLHKFEESPIVRGGGSFTADNSASLHEVGEIDIDKSIGEIPF